MSDAGFYGIVILAICFYFLPTMIASVRHSKHGVGIFWVNLIFGWTVLGLCPEIPAGALPS